jgi:hypothetical protein
MRANAVFDETAITAPVNFNGYLKQPLIKGGANNKFCQTAKAHCVTARNWQ